MAESRKTKAERQFAATQKKDKQVLKQRDEEDKKFTARMAALKALRLAKEAADAADKDAAEKAAKK